VQLEFGETKLRDFYCVDCKMFLMEMECFIFTNKENISLKFINDIIEHIVEAEFYKQYKYSCVKSVKLAINENNSKIVYTYIYINVTHMHVAFCVLLLGLHWQLCAWLTKSRGNTCCP
jgi:hypothetical protein